MIVIKRLMRFEIEARGAWTQFPVQVDFKPLIGYLPVYATLEDARQDFPDAPYEEIVFASEP